MIPEREEGGGGGGGGGGGLYTGFKLEFWNFLQPEKKIVFPSVFVVVANSLPYSHIVKTQTQTFAVIFLFRKTLLIRPFH